MRKMPLTDLINLLAKVIPYPFVLHGYTSFEKNLRTSLRSGSIFPKNLAGQGHGIDNRQQI
jgi:hypothetical protein